MTIVKMACVLAVSLPVFSGCATGPSTGIGRTSASAKAAASLDLASLLPPKDSKKAPDRHIRKGVLLLQKGEYSKASQEFNLALSLEPQNSYFHFLNGLAYHLVAETSDTGQFENARLGYEVALKLDSNNWLAALQLARIHLKEKRYPDAQDFFAKALLFQADNVDALFGLAQASYYVGDLETADAAIRRAKELDPGSAETAGAFAMISAASGKFKESEANLADLRRLEPARARLARIEERIADWRKLHSSSRKPGAAGESDLTDAVAEPKADDQAGPAEGLVEPKPKEDNKMVVLDVVMIRTEELETTNKGVNILQGLELAVNGNQVYTRTSQRASGAEPEVTWSQVFSRTIGLSEVKYNLNIFNAAEDRNEILARPTLVALDGKTAEFFAGSKIQVSVAGANATSMETVQAGVTLNVTPTFKEDGAMELAVDAQRSFFELGAQGTFQQAIRISDNKIKTSVLMRYGQTLVLGGLREKQTTEIKSGVPLLRDIPLLQYVFSNEKTVDFHKSILVLITPRRVIGDVHSSSKGFGVHQDVSSNSEDRTNVKEFREKYGALFSSDNNLAHVMRHLSKHKVYSEYRQADIFDRSWWGETERLNIVLRRALSFMYY